MQNNLTLEPPSTTLNPGPLLTALRIGWVLLVVVSTISLILSYVIYLDAAEVPLARGTLALFMILPAVTLLLAAIIFLRRPDDWMALLTSIMLILVVFLSQNGASQVIVPAYPAWYWPGMVLDFLSNAAFALVLYIFPDGRFVPRWSRWVLLVGLPSGALYSYGILTVAVTGIRPPWLGTAMILFLASALVGLGFQIYRYRQHSTAAQRQQIKWVLFGLSGLLITSADFFLIFFLSGAETLYDPVFLTPPAILAITVPQIALPVGFLMAILRYRLWDIDLIIRRTFTYTAITALLAAVYLGAVTLLQDVFSSVIGSESPLAVVISTLAIAALFTPLRRRVQTFVDRRFNRSKYNAEQTLEAFAESMRDDVDMDHLSAALIGVVEETMQPTTVGLWIQEK